MQEYITLEEQDALRAQLREGHKAAAQVFQASKDDLGDRMKRYEAMEGNRKLFEDLPIYVRLDGRAFSTFTRGLERPYDRRLSWIMAEVTKTLMMKNRVQIAYTQSDEISLGWFAYENIDHFLFGGRIQKLTTILAGQASARFNQLCTQLGGEYATRAEHYTPHFDARVYQIRDDMELMNSFVWREQDCRRNSVSMAAQAVFSHKELQGKNTDVMRGMLAAAGKPYEAMPEFFRKGSYFQRVMREVPIENSDIPEKFRGMSDTMIRSKIIRVKNHPWSSTAERLAHFK